jgi:hypothetical protein
MVSEDLRRENLVGKSIVELNQLCRDHTIKGVIGRPKGDMINYMVAFNENRPVEEVMAEQGQTPPPTSTPETGTSESGSPGGGWQNLDEVQTQTESESEQTQSEPAPEAQTQEESQEETPQEQPATATQT